MRKAKASRETPRSAPAGRLAQRRRPQQQRSRATADSIRQATLELLARGSSADLSAAAIARRAGVGVGSFYDYFPNKEAVLIDLFEGASSLLARSMRENLAQILDLPVAEAVGSTIRQLLSLYEQHRIVLVDLPRELPELRLQDHPLSFEKLGHGSILIYLEHRGKLLDPDELETRAFFVEQIIVGCVRQFIADPPRHVSRDSFIAHLSQIVTLYMRDLTPAGRLEVRSAGGAAGASQWEILRRIVVPLLLPAVASGWVFVFLIGANELSMSVLLAGPRSQVMAVAMFELWSNGQSGEVYALGMLWTLFMTSCALIFYLFARKTVGAVSA